MKKLNDKFTEKWKIFTKKCRKMDPISKTYKDTICDAIFHEYGGLKHGAKILAQKINVSYRSVERWFYKETAPKGEQLIDLMAENEAIADRILQLVQDRRQQRQSNAMD